MLKARCKRAEIPSGRPRRARRRSLRGDGCPSRSSSAASARDALASPHPPKNASVRCTSSGWKRRNEGGSSGSSSTKAPFMGNPKNQFGRGMRLREWRCVGRSSKENELCMEPARRPSRCRACAPRRRGERTFVQVTPSAPPCARGEVNERSSKSSAAPPVRGEKRTNVRSLVFRYRVSGEHDSKGDFPKRARSRSLVRLYPGTIDV